MLPSEFLGYEFWRVASWFLVYSILGWFVESTYMSICNKKLTNRGFIRGPICPIYGVGALAVFFILRPVSQNYFLLYFLGAAVATIIEFITAKLMIRIFGYVWWDYRKKPFNYKGILCLESTLAWGLYTVILFLFLQKGVEAIVNVIPQDIVLLLTKLIFIYFAIDMSISLIKALARRKNSTGETVYSKF